MIDLENTNYTPKESKILTQISNYCESEYSECQCCPEEECILFRIEKILEKEKE